jgi:hypothetical protein
MVKNLLSTIRHLKFKKIITASQYLWYHQLKFGITNIDFGNGHAVFKESFIEDQYNIRPFLNKVKSSKELFFFDIGRNHGLVFYYTMFNIMQLGFDVSTINYVGIDPSPLNFVYFNYFDFLRENKIQINYLLIDRAVVFEDVSHVKLKYGESNFGNFNVEGSNYAQKLAKYQDQFSYVEVTVETISLSEIRDLISKYKTSDSIIIKIDCKNQTDRLFFETLDILSDRQKPYLVASEKDGSTDRDVSKFQKKGNVLIYSNVS